VACRQTGAKGTLVRLTRTPSGVAVDPVGRAPGRGAYLHADPACLELARRRRSLDRALKAPIPEGVWDDLGARLDRRER
jgi:predicted RNA-binding protein YlxR (DUF448 family)